MSDSVDDPIYRSSRRESLVVLGAWLVCCVYTLTYCFVTGYGRPADEVRTLLGVPRWLLFGVFAPWAFCNLFAFWFCFVCVRDGDLGEEGEAEEEGVGASG